MAQHLVELCTILVEESFGDVAALIWAHLAEHGRTQFAGLNALARVTPTQLSRLLPILISHRTIVWYLDPDYNATWYSVDIEGTYNLLRLSKLGDIVKQRCGKDAAHIITNMAQLGHLTVGELLKVYGFKKDENMEEHGEINGIDTAPTKESEPVDSTSIRSADQLYAAISQLVKAGFLLKATPRLFHTDFDVQQTLEKIVQEEQFPDGKVTGPKASHMFAQAVKSQKRKQRDDDVVPGITGSHPNKRQKLNGAASAHRQLPDDLTLSINMKKYVIALRSKSYVRMAARHLGDSSASIYDYFLQTLERQLYDVTDGQLQTDADTNEDEDDDCFATATAANVYDIIDPSTDFTSSIKVPTKDLPSVQANGKQSGYVQAQEDFSSIGIKQEHDSDDDGTAELSSYQNRAKLLDLIERHLQSLEEHSQRFCHRQGQGKPAVWTVNFRSITESIILAELDASITARFGKPAVRLLRLLRVRGKLEEKQIAAFAFMQMKDVRQILSELYGAGYVEAQELAKDQTRQPAKALYLWYFDAPKIQRMLIQQCYQSMSRLYQRMAAERRRFKEALRKMRVWNAARFFGDNYHSVKSELQSKTEIEEPIKEAEALIEDDEVEEEYKTNEEDDDTNDNNEDEDEGAQLVDDVEVVEIPDENGMEEHDANQANGTDKGEATEQDVLDDADQIKALDKKKTPQQKAADDAQQTKATGEEEIPQQKAADVALPVSSTNNTDDTQVNGRPAVQQVPDLQKRIAPPTRYVLGASGVWRMDALHSFEKERMKEWRAIESNYLGQIMRLDDLLMLLRDFDGRHPITSA